MLLSYFIVAHCHMKQEFSEFRPPSFQVGSHSGISHRNKLIMRTPYGWKNPMIIELAANPPPRHCLHINPRNLSKRVNFFCHYLHRLWIVLHKDFTLWCLIGCMLWNETRPRSPFGFPLNIFLLPYAAKYIFHNS